MITRRSPGFYQPGAGLLGIRTSWWYSSSSSRSRTLYTQPGPRPHFVSTTPVLVDLGQADKSFLTVAMKK